MAENPDGVEVTALLGHFRLEAVVMQPFRSASEQLIGVLGRAGRELPACLEGVELGGLLVRCS